MNVERTRGIAIGGLFLVATAAFYAADVLILGVPDGTGGTTATATSVALRIGSLFLFLEGLAAVAIAVLIYRPLQACSEAMARAYFGLRMVETAGILILMAPPLLLAAGAGAGAPGIDWSALAPVVYLPTAAAGAVLAWALWRAALVPRPIALLGLVGYPLLVSGTVLELFELLELRRGTGLFLGWPVGLFELAFPIWLIARGFNERPGPGGQRTTGSQG